VPETNGDEVIAAVLDYAGLSVDEDSRAVADEALGRALVWFGQEYIADVSDHWDVDLFFDVYGTPPSPVRGWSQKILDGLASRKDFPADDRARILDRARTRATTRLREARA
jgi:hypothetical protein